MYIYYICEMLILSLLKNIITCILSLACFLLPWTTHEVMEYNWFDRCCAISIWILVNQHGSDLYSKECIFMSFKSYQFKNRAKKNWLLSLFVVVCVSELQTERWFYIKIKLDLSFREKYLTHKHNVMSTHFGFRHFICRLSVFIMSLGGVYAYTCRV